jgi:hypothetical protein
MCHNVSRQLCSFGGAVAVKIRPLKVQTAELAQHTSPSSHSVVVREISYPLNGVGSSDASGACGAILQPHETQRRLPTMMKAAEYALPAFAFWVAAQLPKDDPEAVLALRVGLALLVAGYVAGYGLVLRRIAARCDRTVFSYYPPKTDKKGRRVPDDARDPSEAVVTTAVEYDGAQLRAHTLKAALALVVLTGTHLAFNALTPIAFALFMAPWRFVSDPLVSIHLLGKPAAGELARPFDAGAKPPPSLLGEVKREWAELRGPAAAAPSGGAKAKAR